jgi:hypothetical protein
MACRGTALLFTLLVLHVKIVSVKYIGHVWSFGSIVPQVTLLSGGPVSRDIFGASRTIGEANDNLVYPSPWDFKRSLTCRKILRHGTSGFTSHPKV